MPHPVLIYIMGIFSAQETRIDGKRAILLRYGINRYDRDARLISLIVERELAGFRRFPAAYQFLEMTDQRRYPIIRVLAAPGVSVLLRNYHRTDVLSPAMPDFKIYRVQDPELVPPMASDIWSFAFIGRDEINRPTLPLPFMALTPDTAPKDYFRVNRLPDQVTIEHPFSQTAFRKKLPRPFVDRQYNRDNALARFAYEFDPDGDFDHADKPLLKIVKTPAVEIQKHDRPSQLYNPRPDLRVLRTYWRIFEVDNINEVPPQGCPIERKSKWREINSFPRMPSIREDLVKAFYDTAIGIIPIFGDLVDVGELTGSIVSGHDRWGEQVTVSDQVVMGVGTLLPFVNLRGLTRAGRLLRHFGQRVQTAEELIEPLRRASISPQDAELIRAMEILLRAGRRPTVQDYERFTNLMRRVQGDYPSIELFLNSDRTGFTHLKLQEAFQQYRQGELSARRRPIGPREWAQSPPTRQREARRILRALLGPDPVAAAGGAGTQRFINILDIPLPQYLTASRFNGT